MLFIKSLLAKLYGSVVNRRNRRFDRGIRVERVPIPVVSIGNLTTGGTGKSPVTQHVVSLLLEAGFNPVIVSRGYGRTSKGPVIVRDTTSIVASVEEAGDEAMMHARTLNIPVVVAEKRVVGANIAHESLGANVIVLDDGFQHRYLYRDVDIVVVDRSTTLDAALLPLGHLREPLASLKRASYILASNTFSLGELASAAPGIAGTTFSVKSGSPTCVVGKSAVLEKAVLMSSIAHPERFRASAEQIGVRVRHHIELRDHAWYTESTIREAIQVCKEHSCENILVTAKDMVKLEQYCAKLSEADVSVWLLPIRLELHNGNALRDVVLNGITQRSDSTTS